MSSSNPIHDFFSTIAPRYDLTNNLLSLGLHHRWKKKLVTALNAYTIHDLLDVCAGTGDIGFALAKLDRKIVSLDFCAPMLDLAKVKSKHYPGLFEFVVADACQMNFSSAFDAVTIAYGIRNLPNIHQGCARMYEALRPGGICMILELTTPSNFLLHTMHQGYLKYIVPLIGAIMTKNRAAYSYLSQSICHFYSPETVVAILQQTGFKKVEVVPLCGGIATLFKAFKLT